MPIGEAAIHGEAMRNGPAINRMGKVIGGLCLYGRALAILGLAPVATHNAFDSIADTSDSYGVPITDLVINRRKPPNQTRKIATAKKKFCEKECDCRDHRPQEAWPALEVQYPYDI